MVNTLSHIAAAVAEFGKLECCGHGPHQLAGEGRGGLLALAQLPLQLPSVRLALLQLDYQFVGLLLAACQAGPQSGHVRSVPGRSLRGMTEHLSTLRGMHKTLVIVRRCFI